MSYFFIDQAVKAAYSADAFDKHQVIYRGQAANSQYYVADKDHKPSDASRLTLSEIVDIVKARLSNMVDDDKKRCGEALGYMGKRKATVYQGSWGKILQFLTRLANYIQSKGFCTAADQALALEQDIQKSQEAPLAPPPASPPPKPLVIPPSLEQDIEILDLSASPDDLPPFDAAATVSLPAHPTPWYRKKIFEETMYAAKNGYKIGNKVVPIDETKMLQETMIYDELPPLAPLSPEKQFKTLYCISQDDTFNVLVEYKKAGFNPVGINMANRDFPGGGVKHGAMAQEEALCRRSNHLIGLETQEYPLPVKGGVYCPHVSVFRKDEKAGYAFMDQPETVSLVGVAAYNLNTQHGAHDKLSQDEYLEGTKAKITNMLRIMALKGHTHLVLGALGCGAFQNQPKVVAQIFKEVFQTPEFRGRFQVVDFAILCLNPKDKANVDAFNNMRCSLMFL